MVKIMADKPAPGGIIRDTSVVYAGHDVPKKVVHGGGGGSSDGGK